MLALLLLLFPNGRLRSRRWRPAAWFVAAVYTALGLALIVRATRFWAHHFRPFPDGLYPWSCWGRSRSRCPRASRSARPGSSW
jgi:hypothetical protein